MTPGHPADTRADEDDLHELAATLRRIARGVWSRRVAFAVVLFTTIVLVQVAVFFWPATYAAKAAVLIQQGRRAGPDATGGDTATVMFGEISDEEVNSERAILLSAEVLGDTVTATGLDRAQPPWYMRIIEAPIRLYERYYSAYHGVPVPDGRDRAMTGLGSAVNVERLKDTNVLGITLEIGDPRVAEIVLSDMLKHYIERQVTVHAAERTNSFFPAQAAVAQRELNTLEDELQRVKRTSGVVEPTLERELELRRLGTLREELAGIQRRQVELDGKIASYTDTRAAAAAKPYVSTTTRAAGSTLDELHAQVLRLELEEIALRAKYQPDFRLVIENRDKLKAARDALEQQRRDTVQESTTADRPTVNAAEQQLADLVAERSGLARRRRELDTQITASEQRLVGLDQQVVEGERLTRQITVSEQKYKTYLAEAERSRMNAALDAQRITNVTVLQQPVASRKPVRPRKVMMLLISFVAGVLFAFLTCAWLELRQSRLEGILDAVAPRRDDMIPERLQA